MFKTAQECINFIENIEKFSIKTGLKRMKYALDLLDNPHLEYKKVLVSGTNGKGSTLSFLKNILMNNNLKIGNFISPYVVCFNERISIDNEYISDKDLVKYTNKVYEIWLKVKEENNEVITFFEVITLIAFLYFKDQKVDYALIEIGIESRFDSTQVADYDLVLLTNVGYDHMNLLGNTLEKIASEQIHILKENNHLITTENNFKELFLKFAKEKKATIKFVNPNINYTYDKYLSYVYDDILINLNLIGNHQISNSLLALEASKYLISNIDIKTIQKGLEETFWPGRFEKFNINGKQIIIDGAHNISGIEVLVKSVVTLLGNKVEITFMALKDKETPKMIHALEAIALSMTFTTIDDPRAKDPNILYEESNMDKKTWTLDYKEAINKHLKTNNILVITGSLHFISKVRKYLLSLKSE